MSTLKKEFGDFLNILEDRFFKNMHRHGDLKWEDVISKLNAQHLKSILIMEESGGEPDVFVFNNKRQQICYVDFSKESPKERRSLCYDEEALVSRKTNKPTSSAMSFAQNLGIEILNEEEYFSIQNVEPLDLKTSSWLKTDDNIRKLGGAIFGDRRFERVFIYHNGAESYYASRGFRGKLAIG